MFNIDLPLFGGALIIAVPLGMVATYYLLIMVDAIKNWVWWPDVNYDYQQYKPKGTVNTTNKVVNKPYYVGAKKGPITPPHASFFGKIDGESLQSTGPLEERYLTLQEQRDYMAEEVKKLKEATKKAEQNRIVAKVEEKVANEKAKTYH